MPNGTGEVNYADGSRYVGEFLNGKRHGKGMHIDKDCVFEGEFYNGKIEGFCSFEKENG